MNMESNSFDFTQRVIHVLFCNQNLFRIWGSLMDKWG